MYQVNLLPWRSRLLQQRYTYWLRLFGGQLLLVLSLFIGAFFLLEAEQKKQQNRLQSLAQQQTVLLQQLQQKRQVMARLSAIAAAEVYRQQNHRHNQRYLAFLQQLSLSTPEALWLTIFEENMNGISLQGFAAHYAAIIHFEQSLATMPLLQDSYLAEVRQHNEGVLAFTLKARWASDG